MISFNPNGEVTIAQFGTVLSRLLYGNRYNSSDPARRYQTHLNALHVSGIMKDISNPMREEIRGYVMLMLMRSKDSNAQ